MSHAQRANPDTACEGSPQPADRAPVCRQNQVETRARRYAPAPQIAHAMRARCDSTLRPLGSGAEELKFDFDRDVSRTYEAAAVNDAVRTLHTSFAGHGGKMILYHGLSDQAAASLRTGSTCCRQSRSGSRRAAPPIASSPRARPFRKSRGRKEGQQLRQRLLGMCLLE